MTDSFFSIIASACASFVVFILLGAMFRYRMRRHSFFANTTRYRVYMNAALYSGTALIILLAMLGWSLPLIVVGAMTSFAAGVGLFDYPSE